MNRGKVLLSIYTRKGCCLCEDMLSGLKKWQEQYSFDIELVDIDSDQDLLNRFAARIPVLADGTTEICQYYLDEAALGGHLNNRNTI